MQLDNLHKITCLGELDNPLYYCKESGKLFRYKVYTPQGRPLKKPALREIKNIGNHGYLRIKVNSKKVSVHQVVAMEFLGHKPDGYKVVVDHVDSNPLNNRINNLQLVSQRVNTTRGKLYTNKVSSLPLNISWHKQRAKYEVKFRFNGRKVSFGLYASLEAAVMARDEVQSRLVDGKESLETFKSRLVTAKRFSY